MKKSTLVLILFIANSISYSFQQLEPFKTSTPPIIDGKLDDQVWTKAAPVSEFKSFAPDYGKEDSERTTAYAAYDSENLYFAFYCHDREPDKIKSSISSRDNIRPDDWVCINLDTFNDHQSLYAFYVNPFGIQTDSRFAAGQEDFSADYIWHSAGKLQDDGYTVEIQIPLKSIRYSEGDPVVMSIFFERYISRLTEHDSYPELDPSKGMAFLTQMAPLVYNGLKHYTLFELLPAFTYSNKSKDNSGKLVRTENKGELSLTAKYGITSDLILDGTYNPDFSQIEADAGQVDVNLRYALYYPEKRPFFQEGSEIYNVAATQSSEIDPIRSFVHTRTIINPLTGFKLSGKIGTKNTLASMYAMDELPAEESQANGNYAYVPIIRYKQSLSDDSYLGGIFTDRETKDHYNRVAGIDGMLRLTDRSTLEWNGLFSGTKSGNSPDLLAGHTFGLRFNYDTRDLYIDLTSKKVSQNFNSETGYLARTGVLYFTGLLRPKYYPQSTFFQRIDLELFSAQTRDEPSTQWETFNHVSAQAFFMGALSAKVKYSYSTEVFANEKFKTGGFHVALSGQLFKEFSFSLLYRRINAIYYSETPYQGRSNRATVLAIYQPSEKIESYSSFVFSDFSRSSDSKLIYEYPIFWERLTYQLNKYLFFRGVVEYNKYKRQLLTDFLISFTYVPGTVIHLGYGSLYLKSAWNENENRYTENENFSQMQRGFFFKMSYLWRM